MRPYLLVFIFCSVFFFSNGFTSTGNLKNATSKVSRSKSSQTRYLHVRGRVIDQDLRTPMPGVTCQQEGTLINTSTDFDGKFNIRTDLSIGSDSIIFSFVGYQSKIIPIPYVGDADSTVLADIELKLFDEEE